MLIYLMFIIRVSSNPPPFYCRSQFPPSYRQMVSQSVKSVQQSSILFEISLCVFSSFSVFLSIAFTVKVCMAVPPTSLLIKYLLSCLLFPNRREDVF